jgi:hypothetical protein
MLTVHPKEGTDMPKIKRWEFKVEGNGEFPFDMLRYDHCWPKQSDPDVINLAPHGRSTMYKTKRQVTLTAYNEPTAKRWESFGWPIIDIKALTY